MSSWRACRQRPPGVMAGCEPQFGVRRDSEGSGGEVLHPITLAGGNSGRRGRYQPAGLVLGVGAENGRTFQVPAEQAKWEKLRENDQVKVKYRTGKYTGTVWAAEIE